MRALAVAAVLSCVLLPASAEEVLTLTSSTFDGALKEHPFLVVEFFAPWYARLRITPISPGKRALQLSRVPSWR